MVIQWKENVRNIENTVRKNLETVHGGFQTCSRTQLSYDLLKFVIQQCSVSWSWVFFMVKGCEEYAFTQDYTDSMIIGISCISFGKIQTFFQWDQPDVGGANTKISSKKRNDLSFCFSQSLVLGYISFLYSEVALSDQLQLHYTHIHGHISCSSIITIQRYLNTAHDTQTPFGDSPWVSELNISFRINRQAPSKTCKEEAEFLMNELTH